MNHITYTLTVTMAIFYCLPGGKHASKLVTIYKAEDRVPEVLRSDWQWFKANNAALMGQTEGLDYQAVITYREVLE